MDVKPLFNSMQAAEKVYQDFTVTATNPGGHSSVPRPDNAIYELADALARLARFSFPVAFESDDEGVLRADREGREAGDCRGDAGDRREPQRLRGGGVPVARSALRVDAAHDLRRDAARRRSRVQRAATDGVGERELPNGPDVELRGDARDARASDSPTRAIKITNTQAKEPDFPKSTLPVDPSVLAATTEITKAMFGDIPVVPTMSTGATDSHYLRAVGIPSYGISGIFSLPGETNAHGRDEKLRVKSYYDGLEFLDQLVRRLAGGVQP